MSTLKNGSKYKYYNKPIHSNSMSYTYHLHNLRTIADYEQLSKDVEGEPR